MKHNVHAVSDELKPRRPLRADFAAHTMRHAATAKRRATTQQLFKAFLKEQLSMKPLLFLRTAPGAALAIAVLATTSVGTYALANWFHADITVKQNNTVLSVDLSECKGSLPPGVAPSSDKHNVQFKILGNPHISDVSLRQKLLAECEYQAVVNFYQDKLADAHLHAGKVTSISDETVGVSYQWGGKTNEKTFSFTSTSTAYSQGSPITIHNLQPGDSIVFVTQNQAAQEGIDPLAATTGVLSIFKTQYDTAQAMNASKNGFYEDNNIMPLDAYKQLHK